MNYAKVKDNVVEVYPYSFKQLKIDNKSTSFPEDFDFVVGNTVYGKTGEGQDFSARIHEVGDDSVMLDFNHPLAGKDLNFTVELLEVK